MLQLLVVLFAPYYVFGIPLSFSYRFYAVIIGFSLNYAAYFAQIYRSGFQGIPVGQREAATLLGYGRRHTYFRILFPQMVKRVLPPVTNEVITLVKDTSLAYVVSFTEMFYIGQQLSAAQKSLLPLFVAGAFYYVFNFVIAFISLYFIVLFYFCRYFFFIFVSNIICFYRIIYSSFDSGSINITFSYFI